MATFRDLLRAAKATVNSVTTEAAAERIASGYTVLDVREPDEYQEGAIPGAIHIPRGHLESQVENRLTDKTKPVLVYCASGVRSVFAANTLQQLGYDTVAEMAGGFNRWKDEGRDWKKPASLSAEQQHLRVEQLLLALDPDLGEQEMPLVAVHLLGAQ